MKPRHKAQQRLSRRAPGDSVGAVRPVVQRLEDRSTEPPAATQMVGEGVEIRERQYVRLAQTVSVNQYCPQLKRLIREPYRQQTVSPKRVEVPTAGTEPRERAASPERPKRPRMSHGAPVSAISHKPVLRVAPFARRREAMAEEASWT